MLLMTRSGDEYPEVWTPAFGGEQHWLYLWRCSLLARLPVDWMLQVGGGQLVSQRNLCEPPSGWTLWHSYIWRKTWESFSAGFLKGKRHQGVVGMVLKWIIERLGSSATTAYKLLFFYNLLYTVYWVLNSTWPEACIFWTVLSQA